MPNIVICCDGTWNTKDQEDNGRLAPTNVFKIKNAIADKDAQDVEQKAYYRQGVGTSGSLLARATGGALGKGLSDDVKSAYKWLCETYTGPDDAIYLFGFSRGAFTVRSLGGLIGRYGILKFAADETEAQKWARIKALYACYRVRSEKPGAITSDAARHEKVDIHFLGVWDTVGALGVPHNWRINLFGRHRRYQFHDTTLGQRVKTARHALALDERRMPFAPTLWDKVDDDPRVKQIWFAGVHGDVGGSYADRSLGDITLRWMMDEAEPCGLVFRPEALEQIHGDRRGVLHDSYRGIFWGFPTRPRGVPRINDPQVHVSARRRHRSPPIIQPDFWPTEFLKPGDSVTVPIYARERWNMTRVFLEEGARYRFTASGEWLDKHNPVTPAGQVQGNFRHFLSHSFVRLVTKLPSLLKGLLRRFFNPNKSVPFSRRHPGAPLFSLVGEIANGRGTINDPKLSPRKRYLRPHESFPIGSGTRRSIGKPGYLYCYANDVWSFYGNNKGSVKLTITRET